MKQLFIIILEKKKEEKELIKNKFDKSLQDKIKYNSIYFRMIPGAPGEPNTFEVTATAREPPADSADGHAHGTVWPVRHSPSPPRGDAIMPSEEETDDGISTVRRYRLPKDGDETIVEFALTRYSHPVKLTDFEADKIIDAYSRGLGKLLNTALKSSDYYWPEPDSVAILFFFLMVP